MGLLDQIRVTTRQVFHDLRRPYDIYQLKVHQIFLSKLFPDSKGIDRLADLKDVVWFRVHLVDDVREIAVEHGPDEACNHKDDGGVKCSEAVTTDDVLVLIAVDIQRESFGRVVLQVQAPVYIVGAGDIGDPVLAEEIQGDPILVRLVSGAIGALIVVDDGSWFVDIVDGVQADQGNVEIWEVGGSVADG